MTIKADFNRRLEIGDGAASEVFSPIEYTVSVPDIPESADQIETTVHPSAAVSAPQNRTYIPSPLLKLDAYEITLHEDLTNTNHKKLRAAMGTQAVTNFRLVFEDGLIKTFGGIVGYMNREAADSTDPKASLTTVGITITTAISTTIDSEIS